MGFSKPESLLYFSICPQWLIMKIKEIWKKVFGLLIDISRNWEAAQYMACKSEYLSNSFCSVTDWDLTQIDLDLSFFSYNMKGLDEIYKIISGLKHLWYIIEYLWRCLLAC